MTADHEKKFNIRENAKMLKCFIILKQKFNTVKATLYNLIVEILRFMF